MEIAKFTHVIKNLIWNINVTGIFNLLCENIDHGKVNKYVTGTTKFTRVVKGCGRRKAEGEFLVGFEGLESTLRIGLAVGRPWSQNH